MKQISISMCLLLLSMLSFQSSAGVCRPSCDGVKGACSCVTMDTGERCCGSANDKISSTAKTDTRCLPNCKGIEGNCSCVTTNGIVCCGKKTDGLPIKAAH